MSTSLNKQLVAEFVGTFALIFVGIALASGHWHNHLVYWGGPLIAGALGGLVYGRYVIKEP